MDAVSQVSTEFEINLSHCFLSALVHFPYLPSNFLSSLTRLTKEVKRGNLVQMARWLQQEMLHPLGLKTAGSHS